MDEETADRPTVSEAAKVGLAQWQQASSFQELCELMACFIEGTCKYRPGYGGETLDEESEPLIDYLAALNRAGFLTDCSQPGLDAGPSKQRAFVTGFASEAVAAHIEKLSVTTDLYVAVSRPSSINGCLMPVTIDVFKACTWAGDTAIDDEKGYFIELEHFEADCGPLAFQKLRQACYLSVIDLCWGRKDYLWNELAKALCFSLE
jgi:hypothetical protein